MTGLGDELAWAFSSVASLLKAPGEQSADVDVLFAPHNAYHAVEMAEAAKSLGAAGRSSSFLDLNPVYQDEGAMGVVQQDNLPSMVFRSDVLELARPGALFVMNDWERWSRRLVVRANRLGIPTFGYVEGAQDFRDTHVQHNGVGQRRYPYQTVTYPLLVGDYDARFIKSGQARVVGSHRMEQLTKETPQFPKSARVCINSNFTYGLYADCQMAWLASVVEACKQVGLEFVVSQHHADTADLSCYPTSTRSLYDEIRASTMVISRFSGVFFEAMALGKPVIYHNPHGERGDTFQDSMDAFPITQATGDLKREIERLSTFRGDYRAICERFFQHHVSVDVTSAPSERMARRIVEVIDQAAARKTA